MFWDAKGILLIDYFEKAETIQANIIPNLTNWTQKIIRRTEQHICAQECFESENTVEVGIEFARHLMFS